MPTLAVLEEVLVAVQVLWSVIDFLGVGDQALGQQVHHLLSHVWRSVWVRRGNRLGSVQHHSTVCPAKAA